MNEGNPIVDLGPNDPNTKYALAALLGSTLSQLKTIDGSMVGSSNNIRAVKTDVNQIFSQLAAQQPGVTPPQQINPVANVVNAGINISQPVQQAAPVVAVEYQDPNQLVFDFNKPITPDTINGKLDSILSKLTDIDLRIKRLE
jgi:hypothetical protein